VAVESYHDVGLLHWLSHTVHCNKRDESPAELVRLQIAYELRRYRRFVPNVGPFRGTFTLFRRLRCTIIVILAKNRPRTNISLR
jgi:hypothetical protein